MFRVKSVKIYTGQKKFTRMPSVASVTNMRYAPASQGKEKEPLILSEAREEKTSEKEENRSLSGTASGTSPSHRERR